MIPIIHRRESQDLLAEQMRRQLESSQRWLERRASSLRAEAERYANAPTDSEGEE